jgi:hypothetical protein
MSLHTSTILNLTHDSQNPQCEGQVDRVLFSKGLRSMKGYYTARLEKGELQADAGRIHGITADTVFDVWAGLTTISDPPLATCRAINVGPLRTTLKWQGSLEPPKPLIVKPQKSTKPTLRYHTSKEFKTIFSPLLESQQAQGLPFCLAETTRELADVSFFPASDGSTYYEILAPEESKHRCEAKKLQSLNDIRGLMKSVAFYYHHLRQENLPRNIKNAEHETQAFMSMFDLEVYRLDERDLQTQPIGPNMNLNRTGAVRILVGDNQVRPNIYWFKITNRSRFDVYPHLFYFNSYELSISQSPLFSPELADGR